MSEKQNILIIGAGGGREHAIGWKVAQSPNSGQIFFAPGNAGTLDIGINVEIKPTEISKLVDFAKKEKIDITLALSDEVLSIGVVDAFREADLRIWGPTREASRLEWSKSFAKDFMHKYGLPTARYKVFSDYDSAKDYLKRQTFPIVIKASGLALGKGVVICETKEEAERALEEMLVNKTFGESGTEVVIEDFLTGPEISVHVFSDGKSYKMFPASQDHKKVGEGDVGLNTGGMGTISPLPFLNNEILKKIEEEIVIPTLNGMLNEGIPFEGVLYPGLMLTESGPKILEYNARFGDPETQTYMRLLDTDVLEIFNACIDKKLSEVDIKWKNIFGCNVVLASAGYPSNYEKGKNITGIEEAEMQPDIVVFHAGTKMKGKDIVTNGGRVLGVSATANTLEEALRKAYKAIEKISFDGIQYRKDIGKKELSHE